MIGTRERKRLDLTPSPETELLYTLLITRKEGDLLTYQEMAEHLKCEIKDLKRHSIHSAMRRAMREKDMLFECERGEGYRRLRPREGLTLGQTAIDRTRRSAKRAAVKQTKVDYRRLSDHEQTTWNVQMTILRLMARAGGRGARAAIEAKVREEPIPLPRALRCLADRLRPSASKE